MFSVEPTLLMLPKVTKMLCSLLLLEVNINIPEELIDASIRGGPNTVCEPPPKVNQNPKRNKIYSRSQLKN